MPGFSRSLAELAELAGSSLDARTAQVLLRAFSELHEELSDQVTKAEFRELKAVVQELAEAQRSLAQAQERTEQRVEELAQAQQRTEQRVEELAQAQQRTEQRLEELAQAQQRTEQRVEELAQAQQRTEQRMEELAGAQQKLTEAQRRTEEEVRRLAKVLNETRTMVGGLSDAVGYTLEDRAIRSLPELLPQLAGISPDGAFARRWVSDRRGELIELNILGYGRRATGETVTVVGEAKARARVKDVENVRRLLERLSDTGVVRGELVGVLVSYQVRPEVEERAHTAGVLVVPSYLLSP